MSLPLSYIVSVRPGVLAAGSGNNSLPALMLSQSMSAPSGGTIALSSADAAGRLFGYDSAEYAQAAVYFAAFIGAPVSPAILYVARLAAQAEPAELVGAALTSTLAQIKALPAGTLSVTIDGAAHNATGLSFAAANSLSDVASEIATALGGGSASYSSGTGGFIVTGTATDTSGNVSYATGTLADALGLSQAAGASTNAAISDTSVAGQMSAIRNASGQWASLWCAFDPAAQFMDLATWVGNQADDVAAILHDTAVTAATIRAGSSLGAQVANADIEGVAVVYRNPLVCALIASVPAGTDWSASNGRWNVAFRRASGISPDVTDLALAVALEGGGYNFYGQVAGLGASYNGVYPGSISGEYLWADSYFNQIWLRRNLQLDLVNLLYSVPQIPYNAQGDSFIEAALQNTIQKALNVGAIRVGVTLSELQTQQITAALGSTAARTVQTAGYYLSVNAAAASPDVRKARATPPITLYYTDGQSVQRLNMSAIEVQ